MVHHPVIRFGPAGWRGIVADEITIASCRRLAAAVGEQVRAGRQERRGVFVGHDTRFLADRLAREVADTLAAQGVPVFLSRSPLPTPAAAHAVLRGRRALGVMITGGHLAPEVQGVKILGPDGGPAPATVLRGLEAAATSPASGAAPGRRARTARITLQDTRSSYLNRLRSIARPTVARRARLQVACDPRYGAADGWLDRAVRGAARSIHLLGAPAHPAFGDEVPDCGEAQLRGLARAVRRGRLGLGVAVDGDGDRFGVVDQGGVWVPPNHVLALLADYLISSRRMPGGVARSAATTHLIDAVCALHGRPVFGTPVGFAAIAPRLRDGSCFLGCEENGGLSLAAHMPQRDGLLASLLVIEMIAVRRCGLRDQVRDLFAQVGPRHGRRIDYHVDAATRERVLLRLEAPPASLSGRQVLQVDATDGHKMILADGSWILVRMSGTEPAIRCHIEARTPRDVELLTVAARELITKG